MSLVAISAMGAEPNAGVDERFGRAMYFQIVDTETRRTDCIDNSENRNAMQGAGIASAELVSERGAEAVITGHLGPKAYAALEAAAIPGFGGAGMSVDQAVSAYNEGLLAKLQGES